MKSITSLFLTIFVCGLASAGELKVSTKEPVVVTAPDQWKSEKDNSELARAAGQIETYRIDFPTNRNAVCLVSVVGKDRPELFSDPKYLKNLVKMSSRPYVNSPADLAKVEVKELKIAGGLGFYANFIDPDLVGKPVKNGSYKTATPVFLSLGQKYLIMVTILCDDLNGTDYKDATKILESIKIKS
jgi:hypothetical protein